MSRGKETRPKVKSAKANIGSRKAKQVPGSKQFPIVGIGASAGGLETYTQLLKNLPDDTGMAFVLVQHLDPQHASILADLLVKATNMPVLEVKDGMFVEPNHVYVIPPNVDMAILHGRLDLLPRSTEIHKLPMPIDFFFRSLAQDQGNKAIGIDLSGTASDGAQGLVAIKAEGGITFAQDPITAKYDGMPHAAIAAGGVDFVLSPEGIANELARIGRHPFIARFPEVETVHMAEEDLLRKIFILVRGATGADFTYYKHRTIKRRIARRMILCKMEMLQDYVKYLQEHPDEVLSLYDDILITVTGFFREPDAFEALKREVFPKIIRNKEPDQPIRVWAPGCATGEEAYTIAMSLMEFLEGQAINPPIQIFATDIHERSIEKARHGIYSESIAADISPTRLIRFFKQVEGGYRVNGIIREMCIFARHDVTKDPPFSRLDLISCRNVLIYLGPVLQKKVIPMFHWALNTTGFLMLGASETIGQFTNLFKLFDSKQKIYGRKLAPARLPVEFGPPELVSLQSEIHIPAALLRPKEVKEFDLQKKADRLVLDKYAPAGVVVDENMTIIQFRGHTSPYLEPAPGKASLNLLDMARPGLKLDIRTAVFQSRKTNAPVVKERLRVKYDSRYREINIEVSPIKAPTGINYYLILFKDVTELSAAKVPSQGKKTKPELKEQQEAEQLNKELMDTKEYLQSMVEERDVTNEELRATNEELQSSTEELQSINEELETAKEELQSSNEELTTINEELQNRNIELTQTNNDLSNVLTSVTIPIIMLGSDLRVRRITTQAEKVLSVKPKDLGRRITDIKLKLDVANLDQLIVNVIETVTPLQKEIQDADGRWYSIQIRPYITHEKKIDGAVVSLLDIDSLKRSEREMKEARDYAKAIVETVREPLIVLNQELRVISANSSFYEMFKASPEQTENQLIYELDKRQWNIPELKRLFGEILRQKTQIEDFEVEHEFPQIGRRSMLLNARRMNYAAGAGEMILLAIEDITERKRNEERRRQAKKLSDALNEINALIHSTLDFEQIIQRVLEEAVKFVECETASIILRSHDQWTIKQVYGLSQELVETQPPKKKIKHLTLIANTEKMLVVEDTRSDKRVDLQFMKQMGIRSFAAVPLIARNKVIGVLAFHYVSAPIPFTETQIDFIDKVGAAMSLALKNTELHKKTESRKRILETIDHMGTVIISDLRMPETLKQIVHYSKLLLRQNYSLFLMLNPVKKAFEVAESTGLSKKTRLNALSIAHVRKLGLDKRLSSAVEDVTRYSAIPFFKKLKKAGFASAVFAPVIIEDNLRGIISILTREVYSPSGDDIEALRLFSVQAATAIANATRFESERGISETLQAAVLTVPEKIKGLKSSHVYLSATETARVGGDFFELFNLEGDKIGIAIGDVSGKGLEASALSILTKDAIKAYAHEGITPARVMAKANLIVMRSSAPSSFVTVFFGTLDRKNNKLTYCSCGNPLPVLLREKGTMERLPSNSPPIGAFRDLKYVNESVSFNSGDRLVLYTDGLIEARDKKKNFYGEKRLLNALEKQRGEPIDRIPQLLIEELNAFTGGVLTDDLAILALERKAR